MFKKILVALMLIASTSAFAAAQLTDAQSAELKAQEAKMLALNAAQKSDNVVDAVLKDPSKTMSMAATWGSQAAEAAKGFAEALGIAAHQLNVNVNDFLASPAGKLTAILIIWKVAGAALLKMLFGMSFALMAMMIARVLYLRLFTKEIQLVESTWFWGALKTTKSIRILRSIRDISEDGEWLMLWVMLVVLIGGMLIGGTIMF